MIKFYPDRESKQAYCLVKNYYRLREDTLITIFESCEDGVAAKEWVANHMATHLIAKLPEGWASKI